MKRLFIVFVFVVAAGILAGLLFSRRAPAPTPQEIGPVVEVDPPPRTVEFPQLPAGARFSYDGPKVALPISATTYHITSPATTKREVETKALALASRFFLEGSPSAFWRSGVFAATWDTEPVSLSVSFSKDILSFSLSQRRTTPLSLRLPSPADAPRLVSNYAALPAGAGFVVQESRSEGFDGVVVLDVPTVPLTGYSLGLAVLGTPVLTSEYSEQWAGVIADSFGVVRVLSVVVPFQSLTPAGEASLVSVADAVANLNEGRGALLWITDETAPPGYGTTPIITSAVVHEITLVYVVVGDSLRPAYLMTGSGEESTVVQNFQALVFASPI